MKIVTFRALGIPQAKGSTRAFMPKGWTRPVLTSTCKGLKAWEQAVRTEAQAAANGVFFEGAVSLDLLFALPRPKSLPKKVYDHTKRPDLDKLTRAVGDALTGVLWKDDSQIVGLTARKEYSSRATGVLVTVQGV